MHKVNHNQQRIDDLVYQARNGNISRRQFLRFAALLGMATIPPFLSHLGSPGVAQGATYGGKLRIAGKVTNLSHPMGMMSLPARQILRQVVQNLTYTDENNITHPFLLDRWEASEDLTTWRLYLKKNIFFNNGHPLTTDDIIFSFEQWLNPDSVAPVKTVMGDYLTTANIEKVSPYKIVLHLNRPEIAVPEHLFHPSALILNQRTFEGDFLAAPHGTGPFRIEVFEENIRCLLKRRYDYWQPGLPFLNEVEFLDVGQNMSTRINALKGRHVDLIDLSDIGDAEAYGSLKGALGIQLARVPTSRTNVLRMRVDKEPWHDNRVRRALKLCQHREKIHYLAHSGQGYIANDFHVCPTHPEYCQKKNIKFDPRRAKSLLEEAGYSQGLDIHLVIPGGIKDIKTHALTLQGDAARAGFIIHLQEVAKNEYFRNRHLFDLGITPWEHYPLGITVLKMAYEIDEQGNPGPWNETRWVDEDYSRLLEEAGATLDAPARKKIFCKLEDIQMNHGAVGLSYWQSSFIASQKHVKNLHPHPNNFLFLDKVWIKPKT